MESNQNGFKYIGSLMMSGYLNRSLFLFTSIFSQNQEADVSCWLSLLTSNIFFKITYQCHPKAYLINGISWIWELALSENGCIISIACFLIFISTWKEGGSLTQWPTEYLVFVLEEKIFCSGNKGRNAHYLVKWKDLPYEDATWEDPNDLPEGLEGFQKFVDEYLQRKWAFTIIRTLFLYTTPHS